MLPPLADWTRSRGSKANRSLIVSIFRLAGLKRVFRFLKQKFAAKDHLLWYFHRLTDESLIRENADPSATVLVHS